MDYKVTFKITYKDGDSFTHEESFITKGSNRKVLRAAIKKIIEEMCSENYGLDFENFTNIEVLKIIRTVKLNIWVLMPLVWIENKYKAYKEFKLKLLVLQ